jgi:hypothetical protein
VLHSLDIPGEKLAGLGTYGPPYNDQQEQWADVTYHQRREEYSGSRFDNNPSLEERRKYAREILQNDSAFKGTNGSNRP